MSEYKPGLRVPLLSGQRELLKDYEEAKINGICKCKTPLLLFAGPGNAYCFRCKKIVIDE